MDDQSMSDHCDLGRTQVGEATIYKYEPETMPIGDIYLYRWDDGLYHYLEYDKGCQRSDREIVQACL